jgi:sugar phosphate permease
VSNTIIGIIIALGPLSAILSRATMGVMIRMLSRRAVLFTSIYTACIAIAVVPYFHNILALAVLSAVSGWGSGLNEPMTISMIAAYSHGTKRGVAMGLRLAVNRFSMFISPLMFAMFMKIYSLASAFPITGSLLVFLNTVGVIFSFRLNLGSDLGVRKEN